MLIKQNHEALVLVMHHMPLFRQVFLADVRELLAEYPDLNPTHMQSLMFLTIGGDTTMTRLAQLLRMEKGSVTAVTARLLSYGFISKETDPADRRKSILRLTDRGREFAESIQKAHSAHFSQRISQLTDDEQENFFSHLKLLDFLLKKMGDPDQLRCFASRPDQLNHGHVSHHPHPFGFSTSKTPIDLTIGGTTHV